MLLRIIISSLSTQAICYMLLLLHWPGTHSLLPDRLSHFSHRNPRFYEDVHMVLGVCVGLFPGKLGWIQLVSLSPRRKRGGGGVLKLNIWISQAVMCQSHTSPGCVLGKKLLRPKRGSDKKHQTINAVTPCVRPHHKTSSCWDHAGITEEVPCCCLPVYFLLGPVITANCNLRHQGPKSQPPDPYLPHSWQNKGTKYTRAKHIMLTEIVESKCSTFLLTDA